MIVIVPVMYDYKNVYNSEIAPSTVHCKNTALAWFFKRYLIEKVISVFEFSGIPDAWSKNYFLYTLFVCGFTGVFRTPKYGVIPQHCTLYGYDIFYQPTHIIVANPLLKGISQLRIGKECEIVKMQPDYGGAWDLVSFYADMLAISAESAAVNLINSKLAYVFAGENKAAAETFKKLYDQIASGNPAGFIDKNMFRDDGQPAWTLFTQNLKQVYIAGDILEDMAKWDARFNTEIGIPNVNIAKQSGVSSSEVDANNTDTRAKASLWLESIRDGLQRVNNMYDLNISVKLRFNAETTEGGRPDERGEDINIRPVQSGSGSV